MKQAIEADELDLSEATIESITTISLNPEKHVNNKTEIPEVTEEELFLRAPKPGQEVLKEYKQALLSYFKSSIQQFVNSKPSILIKHYLI